MGRCQVDITPYGHINEAFRSIELFGYYTYFEPTRIITGIHSQIFARSVVLEDEKTKVALVSCDLCEISDEIVEQAKKIILKQTGIENVIISMTHTHSAPATCFGRGLGRINGEYYNNLARQIANSVIYANNNVYYVNFLASGSVEVGGLNRNRSIENGYVDRELSVLSLKTDDGHNVEDVVLCNFACHPVTQKRTRCEREDGSYNLPDTRVSGDFSGVSALIFDSKLRKDLLFLQGADGDMNPAIEYDQTGKTEEMALRFTVGVLDALDSATSLPDEMHHLYFWQFPVRLDFVVPTVEDIKRMATEKRQQKHRGWVRFWNDWERSMLEKLTAKESPLPYYEAEISVLAIGDCVMLFHPAELYSTLGRQIKDASSFRHTFVVSNANGTAGYVAPEDPEDTRLEYSEVTAPAACDMFPYKRGQGDKLVKALIEVVKEAGQVMEAKR